MLPSFPHRPALAAGPSLGRYSWTSHPFVPPRKGAGKERAKGLVMVWQGQSQPLWFGPKMRKLLNATKVLRKLRLGLCVPVADIGSQRRARKESLLSELHGCAAHVRVIFAFTQLPVRHLRTSFPPPVKLEGLVRWRVV